MLPKIPHSADRLLTVAVETLRRSLPDCWQVELTCSPQTGPSPVDGQITIVAPDTDRASFAVEIEDKLDPSDVPSVVARVSRRGGIPLAVAPFLSPRSRADLTKRGVNYVDATGNVRVKLDRPVVFLSIAGAERDPASVRRDVPLRSLRGAAAARIVRALCDFRPPYGVSRLTELADVASSSVTRVLQLLEREQVVARGRYGLVESVDWQRLLSVWTESYSVVKTNRTVAYLDPRGLDTFLPRLAGAGVEHAVTGSLAAARVTQAAPPRLITTFVRDSVGAAERLGLRPPGRTPNVLLVVPSDRVVFARATVEAGVTYAAFSQVAADLMTSPGRGPAEAAELIRWLGEHEDAWCR